MENGSTLKSLFQFGSGRKRNIKQKRACKERAGRLDSLVHAHLEQEYAIALIETQDQSIKDFLFTLGCYPGEKITVISNVANQYVIVIKDARYSIDGNLAAAIILEQL